MLKYLHYHLIHRHTGGLEKAEGSTTPSTDIHRHTGGLEMERIY